MDENFEVENLRAWRRSRRVGLDTYDTGGAGRGRVEEDATDHDGGSRNARAQAPLDFESDGRERHRSRLIAQYGLGSEYIGVSKLGEILGLSPSAIYGHMRAGRFFLPYRLFNAAPKIFIDDLVEWHWSGRGVVPAYGEKPWRETSREHEAGTGDAGRGLTKSEVNEAVDKAANDALRSMGIDPSKRRRRRS